MTTNRKTSAILGAVTTAFLAVTGAAQVSQNPPTPTEAAKGSVNQINWLAGCWQGTSSRDGASISEMWFSPRGGSAMGVGQTYVGDKTTATEAMRMYDDGDSIKLWVRPAGRTETTMTLDNIGDKFAAFSVKENEVITKLRYERKSDSEMLATLRFEQGTTRRGSDFVFDRVDCASLFLPAIKSPPKDGATK